MKLGGIINGLKKKVSRIKRFTVLLMLVLSKCWGVDSQREEPCSARGAGWGAQLTNITMSVFLWESMSTLLAALCFFTKKAHLQARKTCALHHPGKPCSVQGSHGNGQNGWGLSARCWPD